MHFLLPFQWISRRLLILNEKKGVFIFSTLSCVCCTCSKRYRHIKRKYKLWILEESSFCPWAFFGVSGEIKSVTAHISERKEQKHNDVISSRRFHYLQQVNCAGECKRVVSQYSSKKSLRKQTLVWGWLWNNWPENAIYSHFPTYILTYGIFQRACSPFQAHTQTQNMDKLNAITTVFRQPRQKFLQQELHFSVYEVIQPHT